MVEYIYKYVGIDAYDIWWYLCKVC